MRRHSHGTISPTANGQRLCYETFGDQPPTRPLLLIMGLGAQMILWDDDFAPGLAAHGFHYVIRFDNRDIGRSSSQWTKSSRIDLPALMMQAMQGKPIASPYKLADMAADAAGCWTISASRRRMWPAPPWAA